MTKKNAKPNKQRNKTHIIYNGNERKMSKKQT